MLLFVNYTPQLKGKTQRLRLSNLPKTPTEECQSHPTLELTTTSWSHATSLHSINTHLLLTRYMPGTGLQACQTRSPLLCSRIFWNVYSNGKDKSEIHKPINDEGLS